MSIKRRILLVALICNAGLVSILPAPTAAVRDPTGSRQAHPLTRYGSPSAAAPRAPPAACPAARAPRCGCAAATATGRAVIGSLRCIWSTGPGRSAASSKNCSTSAPRRCRPAGMERRRGRPHGTRARKHRGTTRHRQPSCRRRQLASAQGASARARVSATSGLATATMRRAAVPRSSSCSAVKASITSRRASRT